MVLIVGNEMHAQSIVPWRSRNEKKFNSTIENYYIYCLKYKLIPIKRCLAIIQHILKKALKYIASCTPLHPFWHIVDLLLKNIHLYLLNNLWIARKILAFVFRLYAVIYETWKAIYLINNILSSFKLNSK